MKEFFDMGGYAFFIWASYGLALIVLVANLIIPMIHERNLLRVLARKLRRKRRDYHDSNA
ncbi:MAG: heme exporter protein CcmD [Candidatus Parabeggiatoa sp. nov. 2]|nr:MAG: heme exporter protein CcmD [Beggiatoa sp. 4572_84]RKZ57109.1 MAG: heme exporter protein CcmD [Gammaproteobacteria bacterium]